MALSANAVMRSREPGGRRPYPCAAAIHHYQGGMVFIASGYAAKVIAAGVNKFAGITLEEVDNSSGANGDKTVEAHSRGVYFLTGSGFAQTDVGAKVYATDDNTITKTSTNNSYVGTIVEYVSATLVGVELEVFGE